jgi:hypothetical protein
MDFEELKRVPLGDVASAIIKEGGAVTGGLLAAGFAGRQVENILMGATPVTPTSTLMDKAKAAGANLAPKVVGWYLLRGKTGTAEDARKGLVTSAAFDLLMRLTNSGVNPATATVMGYQVLGDGSIVGMSGSGADAGTVQRLVQENGALRNEIGRLKNAGTEMQIQQVPYAAQTPMDPRLPPYVGSSAIPPAERDRRFAFMQPAIPGKAGLPPAGAHRQTKYGFAGETSVSSAGKPGAAYVQAGKMFGMQ